MEQFPAIVTPLNEYMGLEITRSLGKRGIPVYGFITFGKLNKELPFLIKASEDGSLKIIWIHLDL